ncbi:hypothetical protein Pfo_028873 [Paulownia fortunei]|nr:hypothetical protein Pfo_028873 [Paulownia fortunei]
MECVQEEDNIGGLSQRQADSEVTLSWLLIVLPGYLARVAIALISLLRRVGPLLTSTELLFSCMITLIFLT